MGALDDIKGKAKEALGSLIGDDKMREEGQAQQHKDAEEDRAAESRTEAQKHENEAAGHEKDEQRNQGT